jgi:glutamine synthetase
MAGLPPPMVRLEVPDFDLGLRGKLEGEEKASPGTRLSFCTIVYGLSLTDEVTDTPLGSAANGYPDAFAVPDATTRVALPWRPQTTAVIADMVDGNGAPIGACPRSLVKRLLNQFDVFDLEPVFGYEYEVYVTHDDGSARDGQPLGRTINGYSLSRISESQPIVDEFLSRMDGIGIDVEMFHSEIGPGFFEFALAPDDALTATDNAARARQYFRETCAELGFRATFMAKRYGPESGSGGHVHQSLWQSGRNVFSDGSGRLSPVGAAYVAGLLATMAEFSVLFNPFVNSFKRLDPSLFVATRSTWGTDNRNAACRAILNVSEKAARVESRRPGADANPYLVTAALLAGGLHGLRGGLDPGAPLAPGDDLAVAGGDLPADLRAAIAAFEDSALAREEFGETFVETFLATRRAELAAFDTWWQSSITDWELERYARHI